MKQFRYYDILVTVLAAVFLISNLSATKLIEVGPFLLDGGAILFPLAYILGDVLTEVYGFQRARRAIWTGFGVMLLAVLCFTIVRYLPPADVYTNQQAFEDVLGFLPRIVLASLVGYLIGEFVNATILAKMKVKTAGKHLTARLAASTVGGELLDTVVFCLIAFGGLISSSEMVNYILVGWLFKVAVEFALMPVTYRIIMLLKRAEKADVYDKKTTFTPFSLKI